MNEKFKQFLKYRIAIDPTSANCQSIYDGIVRVINKSIAIKNEMPIGKLDLFNRPLSVFHLHREVKKQLNDIAEQIEATCAGVNNKSTLKIEVAPSTHHHMRISVIHTCMGIVQRYRASGYYIAIKSNFIDDLMFFDILKFQECTLWSIITDLTMSFYKSRHFLSKKAPQNADIRFDEYFLVNIYLVVCNLQLQLLREKEPLKYAIAVEFSQNNIGPEHNVWITLFKVGGGTRYKYLARGYVLLDGKPI